MANPFYIDGLVLALTAALPAGSTTVPLPPGTLAAFPALGLTTTFAGGNYIPMTLAPAASELTRETVRITAPVTSDSSGATITATVGSWAFGDKFNNRLASADANILVKAAARGNRRNAFITHNVPSGGAGSLLSAAYPKTKLALAAVLAGTASMKVGLLSDSTLLGVGAGNVSTTGNRAIGPVVSFTAALSTSDIPATANGFFGDGNFYVTTGGASAGGTGSTGYQLYDPRLTLASGWNEDTQQTVGGATFTNLTNSNTLTFSDAAWVPTDTFVLRYRIGSQYVPFTISRTGWTTVTVTPALTPDSFATIVMTGPASVAPIIIGRVGTTGWVGVMSGEVYDSTKSGVRVYGLAWSGGRISNYIGNSNLYSPLPALLDLKLDTLILQLGVNEWGNAVDVPTFQANVDSFVLANINNGTEVVLGTGYPSAVSVAAYAVQLPYITAIYAVAAKYGLVVNDVWRKVGSQERGMAYSLYFDTLHPRNPLYQNAMEGWANVLMSLA